MKKQKFIIRYDDNTEWCYLTRVEENKVAQISKTYSAGVIEFETREEAETVLSKLLHPSGNKLKYAEVIPVYN